SDRLNQGNSSKKRVGLVDQDETTRTMLDEKPALGEPRFSPSRTFYFFLREDVGTILNLGPFNHARSVLAHFRFFLLSLRTRFLILMANGMNEALRQLVLSCLETVCARVLCVAWSTKQQD